MITNSIAPGAAFVERQTVANGKLQEHYAHFAGRQFSLDQLGEPTIWAKDPADAVGLVVALKMDPLFAIDYLTDLTAYDNSDLKDGQGRFVLVYQIFSTTLHIRVRVKTLLQETQAAMTLVGVFKGANWLEREVYDMFGVQFQGHPNLRRIMMDDRFTGHPLRKEYDIKKREPFANNVPLNLGAAPLPENSPQPLHNDFYNPNILVNIGPSHPAMHGTLRVMARLNGETIEDAACEIGYLHRAIEKLGEAKTYHQWIVYTDRLNYCSALNNNIAYCMSVENLMGICVTDRTMWIRMISMELARIIDHIICVAINALDLGAMTVFWHLYYWREEAYTMIESMCGMRLTTSYARIGGLSHDIPEDFVPRMRRFIEEFPRTLDEVSNLLTSNRIWIDRTKGVGVISPEEAMKYSLTGPTLRSTGIDMDLRRDRPYYGYSDLDFNVVIGSNGDVYDRYLIRMEEMRQSTHIIKQCLDRLPAGPIWVQDSRVLIPEKKAVYEQMEVLIHHFKIFMEGIDVPAGESYSAVEGPNGELGFYIVSRGGPKAWRMRVKAPSFMLFQNFEQSVKGGKIADAVAHLGSINIIAGELDR